MLNNNWIYEVAINFNNLKIFAKVFLSDNNPQTIHKQLKIYNQINILFIF